ncbi:MAG: hypothetical protein GXN99_02275, partial [Candidatus Nanohaloarchaeota archaeon]|nr:hypothetical protein [Candidatus Nanohaloarchaeota archaeon]
MDSKAILSFVMTAMFAVSIVGTAVYASPIPMSSDSADETADSYATMTAVNDDMNEDVSEEMAVRERINFSGNGSEVREKYMIRNASRYKYAEKMNESEMKAVKNTYQIREKKNATEIPKAVYEVMAKRIKDPEELNKTLQKKMEKIQHLEQNNWKIRNVNKEAVKNYTEHLNKLKREKTQIKQRLTYLRNYLYQYKSEVEKCSEENFASEKCQEIKRNYTERAIEYLESA